eukprot:4076238-Amphidinium_carterae.3
MDDWQRKHKLLRSCVVELATCLTSCTQIRWHSSGTMSDFLQSWGEVVQRSTDDVESARGTFLASWTSLSTHADLAGPSTATETAPPEIAGQNLFDLVPSGGLQYRSGRKNKAVEQFLDKCKELPNKKAKGKRKSRVSSDVVSCLAESAMLETAGLDWQRVRRAIVRASDGKELDLKALVPLFTDMLRLAEQPSYKVCPECDSVAKLYLYGDEYVMTSRAALEKILNINVYALATKTRRLASACLIAQQVFRHHIVMALVQALPTPSLLYAFETGGYDETPMKVGLRHSMPSVATSSEAFDGSTFRGRNQAMTAKILQTRSSHGFLVELSSGLVGISCTNYYNLQSMGRGNGRVLKKCLEQTLPLDSASSSFKGKCRCMTCDKGSYNHTGEALLTTERGGDISAIMFGCCVHGLANVQSKGFDGLFGPHVTGMLAITLSLRMVTIWSAFRESLLHVIGHKLQIVVGTCPARAVLHKETILRLVLGSSDMKKLPWAVKILHAFTGDWSNQSAIEFYWPMNAGAPPHVAEVAKLLTDAALACLIHRRPPLYPRHRWTGFRDSIGHLLILEGIHSLLSNSYKLMIQRLGSEERVEKPKGQVHAEVVDLLIGDTVLSPIHDMVASTCEEEGQEVTLPLDGKSMAKQNAGDRSKALHWLESGDALAVLVVLAIVLHPIETYLNALFYMAGKAQEKQKRAESAKALLDGHEHKRLYRVEIATSGVLEKELVANLFKTLKDVAAWKAIPDTCCKRWLQTKAFCLISRLGCGVHSIYHEQSKFPMALFQILQNPHRARELWDTPDCLKDAWSLQLAKLYPKYEGAELQALLRLQASQTSVDTSVIEATHASIRRQCVSKSAQTHAIPFEDLSCQYLLQCVRNAVQRKASKKQTQASHFIWVQITKALFVFVCMV